MALFLYCPVFEMPIFVGLCVHFAANQVFTIAVPNVRTKR